MRKVIPVVLDSTVLKNSPQLNSSLLRQLIQHIDVGIFKLYISEIVEREYLTWIREEAQKSFDKVVHASTSLNKYHEEPDILGFKFSINLTAVVSQSHAHINGILKSVNKNWNRFKESSDVTIIPIEHAHTKSVMDAYFSGGPPFKSVKLRQDIPDAFIFNAMLDLLEDNDKVLFVTQDKNLRIRIDNENIVCFENLADLFSKSGYKIEDDFFRNLKDDDKAISLLSFFADYIQAKSSEEIEFSGYVQVVNDELSNRVIGELDCVLASVQNLKLNKKSIRVISENTYLLPFETEIVHSIHSKATIDELSIQEKSRASALEKEEQDDGQFNIIESVNNRFEGNISIRFEDSDPSSWKEKNSDQFWERSRIEEISLSLEDISMEDESYDVN